MIYKRALPDTDLVEVTFELPASLWADKVSVAGEFNDWKPDHLWIRQERDGCWRLRLALPVNRRYEFCYLIDGQWRCDASACRAAGVHESAPNPYGGYNCVVSANKWWVS